MKKSTKIITLFLALAMVLTLSACGKKYDVTSDKYIDMIYVEGGTIEGNSKYNSNNFRRLNEVKVDSFYISQYEISQMTYLSIIWDDELELDTTFHFEDVDNPAESMTWYDAVYFCNGLSNKSDFEPYYVIKDIVVEEGHIVSAKVNVNEMANGYRLPTELEWEYAARGGKDMKSYTYAGSNNVYEVAYTDENSLSTTHHCGLLKPNSIGLYDMSGNVWEYLWDSYGSDVDAEVDFHMIKGGGWWNGVNYAAVSSNFIWVSDQGDADLGIRVVRNK